MSDTPTEGRTVLAHVTHLLAEVEAILGDVTFAVHASGPERRLRAADRTYLRRALAGVISRCETVRIWLEAGAPK